MAKEIAKQPQAMQRLLDHSSDGIADRKQHLLHRPPKFVLLAARGTSDHAALYAKYLIETHLGLPVGLVPRSIFTLYRAGASIGCPAIQPRLGLASAMSACCPSKEIGVKRPGHTPPSPRAELFWPLGAQRTAEAVTSAAQPAVVGVADLRGANAAAVLAAVRRSPTPPRLATLAESTGLSRPTVETIVDDLIASGLLQDAPVMSSRGGESPGRPARRFSFRPEAGYVAAIDVRAYAINVGIANLSGDFVSVQRRRTRRDLTGKARLRAVLDLLSTALAAVDIRSDQVRAATVGTPGWVQDNTKVRYVDNLRDWSDVDVAQAIENFLGCPVAVDNDANLAAVGEQWRGAAQGSRDMIFILIGERVGAGIIAGGQPLHGHHGAAGEIGFIVSSETHAPKGREVGAKSQQRPGLDTQSLYSDAEVVRRAADGDSASISALEAVGAKLAQAMSPVLLALDPEVVVIGASLFGVTGPTGSPNHVVRSAEAHSAQMLVDPPAWKVSTLGDDAVLTGAIRFSLAAIEHILTSRPLNLLP